MRTTQSADSGFRTLWTDASRTISWSMQGKPRSWRWIYAGAQPPHQHQWTVPFRTVQSLISFVWICHFAAAKFEFTKMRDIRDISIIFSILFFLLAQSMWFNQYVGYLCLCCCWFFSLAGEKNKGITYKELKWNKVVKNNETCSLQPLAVCFMLCFWRFFPVLCELCCSPGVGYLPSQFDRHIGPLLLMCKQTDTFAEP